MTDTTMNTGAASLLPCPMCGAAPKLIVGYSPLNHAFVDCDCGMQTALKDTGEEVTAMWNRRSPTTQADAAPSDRKLEPWLYVEEVKQLCRDYSSRNGNVYIKDVESSLDGLANQPLRDTYNGGAIQVLAAIINAKDSGQDASLILDENSPLVDAARAAIAAGGAQEPDVFKWLETELSAISCRYHGDPSYDHDAYWMKDRVMKLIADARKAFALPRVAATVPDGNAVYAALDRRAQSYISREVVEDVLIAVRALLAASNGEQT